MLYSPASLIATGVILPLLGVISTCLRFWMRLSYARSPIGIDDYFIVFGTVFVVGIACVLQILDTVKGQLSPADPRTTSTYSVERKIDYAQVIIEKVAYGCIKLSLLFFYRRIFGVWPMFKKLNTIAIVIVAAWATSYLIGEIFACGARPDILWDHRELAPEKCDAHGVFLLTFAITDVITDVMVLSMPFFYIHRLKMNSRQKWALSGVFLLGFLSTIAGILRLAFLSVAVKYGQLEWNPPPLPNPPPRALTVISPIFWTNVELCTMVIAANLPSLAPLIRKTPTPEQFLSRVYRKLTSSSTSSANGDSKVETVDDAKYSHKEKVREEYNSNPMSMI